MSRALLSLLVAVPAVGVPQGRVVNPDDWVCLRCFLRPTVVAWSGALGSLIHVGGSVVGPADLARSKVPAICGGEVVPRRDAWEHRLRPGAVVECTHAGEPNPSHLVRLGRRQSGPARAWTGTALCGFTPKHAPLWVPVPPSPVKPDVCEACWHQNKLRSKHERAQEAEEERMFFFPDAPDDSPGETGGSS